MSISSPSSLNLLDRLPTNLKRSHTANEYEEAELIIGQGLALAQQSL